MTNTIRYDAGQWWIGDDVAQEENTRAEMFRAVGAFGKNPDNDNRKRVELLMIVFQKIVSDGE